MERMAPGEFKEWLETRTRKFAVSVFSFLDAMPHKPSTRVIAYQLGKSASSIGANYREANRGESRDDFVHKLQIALKEAAESVYWLEVLADLYPMHKQSVVLRDEALQLRNLFQSISQSAHGKRRKSGCDIRSFP